MLRYGVSRLAMMMAVVGAPVAAHAQAASSAAGEPTAIEEVIVTALKTSTTLQDTPATVAVVDRQTLQNSAVNSIQQLGSLVPGVIIQRPPNNTANASIRGLGTSPGPVSFDQGVALFIDGVYAARGADFLSSLFDLDRIEVVKGTQAAVLGKNTSLGALTLTTRGPGHVLGGNLLASYEFERESKIVSGAVDLPVNQDWAIRIAGQHQDLGGMMTNRAAILPGAEDTAQQTRDDAVRVTSAWTPTDKLRMVTNYSYAKTRNIGALGELIVGSPVAQSLFVASGYGSLYEANFDLHYAKNGPTRLDQKADRATNTIDYDLGDAKITAITGLSDFNQKRLTDYDATPATFFTDEAKINGHQFSQEIRIASSKGGPFSYLAGALYLNNKLRQFLTQATYYPTGRTGQFASTFNQDTDTWSAFGQASYDLSSEWTVTGGVRVTNEKKSVEMERHVVVPGSFSLLANPPYPLTHLSSSETVVDGSAAVQYRPRHGVMIYASAGQGTKGGGFTDTAIPANAHYRKEVARTVEAGFKIEGEDRAWRLNGAIFNTDVTDFQNNFFNGVTFIVQNLDIRSRGVEFDGDWRPTQDLTLFANGTFADAINKDAAPGVGDRLPRAPKFAGKAGVNYQAELADRYRLHLGADYTYRSKISHQVDPNAVPYGKAYGTFNAVIGVTDPKTGLDLSLIGRNINDARSLSFAYPAPNMPGAVAGAPEETRTVTLQLRYEF